MRDTAVLQAAMAAALCADDVAHADVAMFCGPPSRVQQRLGFYRGNVQANATKALRSAYPVCAALVGDAFFDALAHAYAAGTPSASGDLNEYGGGFATFLAGFAPAAQVPYLSDVAALEWQVHRAHYAADAAPFDVSALAATDPGHFAALNAQLHPACALVESRWPIARIWSIHQAGHESDFAVDLDAGERALVHRPRFRVEVASVDAAAFAFLQACAQHATLDDATRRALALDERFALEAQLAAWVRDGVIVALTSA